MTTATLPNLADIEAEQFSRSLSAYQRAAWHVVEPQTQYVHNWHIDAITEHLEAVTRGEIRNLLINIPPRHMKSLNVSVFWPTWVWATHPHVQWLYTSYVQSLSTRDSVKCRRLIQSQWYQERWGHVFQMTGDQNVKTRFENDKTGYRIATSVDGGTGEGGTVVITDDPHNIKEGESDTKREGVLVWWDEVMSTRLNDPQTGAKVIMMQRVHERDLSGHVLEQGGYEHLMIRSEYVPTTHVSVTGFKDPRTKPDELLWPKRFTREVIDKLKIQLGEYAYSGQHQQEPTARKGGLFERGWFEVVDEAPKQGERVRYWDKAGTEGGGKYTVGTLEVLRRDDTVFIEDVVRGQWSAPNRETQIKQTAEADAKKYGIGAVRIIMEQEPGSAGKDVVEASILNLRGHSAEGHRPTGNKFTRAGPLASGAKAGNVKVVKADWNEDFLSELNKAGPGATYLDQMDSAAGAYNALGRGGGMFSIASAFGDIAEETERANPYGIG